MNPAALFFATVAIWGTTWIVIKLQRAANAPEMGVAMARGAALSSLSILLTSSPAAVHWSPQFVLRLAWRLLAGSVIAFAAYYGLLGEVAPAR